MREASGCLRTRSTYYTNPQVDGWLHSLSLGTDLAPRLHLELHAGLRRETVPSGLVAGESVNWYGIGLDWYLSRHWFALVSLERTDGAFEDNDQIYASVSLRF